MSTTEVKSINKFILTSPKKIREVAFLIKKMSPIEALSKLPFINKKAAGLLLKSLKTAVANARNLGLSESSLTIKEIQINEGPRLKRFRAGSRGRAKPYKRRMSHIRIVLQGTKEEVIKKDESVEVAENTKKEKSGLKLPGFLGGKKDNKNK